MGDWWGEDGGGRVEGREGGELIEGEEVGAESGAELLDEGKALVAFPPPSVPPPS